MVRSDIKRIIYNYVYHVQCMYMYIIYMYFMLDTVPMQLLGISYVVHMASAATHTSHVNVLYISLNYIMQQACIYIGPG